MKYEHVTNDEVVASLDARLAQFEREHLAHEMNKLAVASLPAGDPGKDRAIKEATEAQATIDKAYAAIKAERDKRKTP